MHEFCMHQHPHAEHMLILEYEGDKTKRGLLSLLLHENNKY
jgi:hypothetical protein